MRLCINVANLYFYKPLPSTATVTPLPIDTPIATPIPAATTPPLVVSVPTTDGTPLNVAAGAKIKHKLKIQNSTAKPDTLSLSCHSKWSCVIQTGVEASQIEILASQVIDEILDAEIIIQPQQSIEIEVQIQVPENAAIGEINAAQVTVKSENDPTLVTTISLPEVSVMLPQEGTATPTPMKWFFPIILR